MSTYKSSMNIKENIKFEFVIENNTRRLRVEQSKDNLSRVRFKNDVYNQYMYLTSLSEMDNVAKPVTRYVYYNLTEKQQLLDDVRVQIGTEEMEVQRTTRDIFIIGLISIYYLVSKGKIYNVPINPMNFVLENKKRVKGFFREDKELGEITDEWLMEFKKLLAFYLVYDTSIIPENFNDYDIQDYVSKMSSGTQQGFKKMYNCVSIDEMLPLFLKEDEINALTYSYPLSVDFQEPIDVSSGLPLDLDTSVVNATTITTEDREAIKQQLLDRNMLDKGKVRKADKKRKELARLEKKRQREEDQSKKRIENGYEPNEAKRKANSYNKGFRKEKPSLVPLIVVLFIILIGLGIAYSKFTGKPILDLSKKDKVEQTTTTSQTNKISTDTSE